MVKGFCCGFLPADVTSLLRSRGGSVFLHFILAFLAKGIMSCGRYFLFLFQLIY